MKGKKLKKAFKEWLNTAESKFKMVGDPSEFDSIIFEMDGEETFCQIGYENEGKSLFFNTYINEELKSFKSSKNPGKLNKWLKKVNSYQS